MTGLPPKADVHPRSCYVAFVPGTDSCTDVEGTPRRWYGEDERTGRDVWCSEHRQHRLRIRERAWRTHSAHDPCLTSSEGDRHHFRFIISPMMPASSGVYENSPGSSWIRPRATYEV